MMTMMTTTTTTTSSPVQHPSNEYLKIFYLFIFFPFSSGMGGMHRRGQRRKINFECDLRRFFGVWVSTNLVLLQAVKCKSNTVLMGAAMLFKSWFIFSLCSNFNTLFISRHMYLLSI